MNDLHEIAAELQVLVPLNKKRQADLAEAAAREADLRKRALDLLLTDKITGYTGVPGVKLAIRNNTKFAITDEEAVKRHLFVIGKLDVAVKPVFRLDLDKKTIQTIFDEERGLDGCVKAPEPTLVVTIDPAITPAETLEQLMPDSLFAAVGAMQSGATEVAKIPAITDDSPPYDDIPF